MVTYERDINHCDVSPYVKEVTIKSIQPAENSDFLVKIEFEEIGWNTLSQKGNHNIGKKVMFIPPESVLPIELGELLNITKYLSKGKVRVTKFRGNRSEGIIVDKEKVEPYIPYILKWEDLPSIHMGGDALPNSEIPMHFHKFYKMPNILNEPDTFKEGECIWYSEKIHGTDCRFGIFSDKLFVGSHFIVLKEDDDNIYWKVVKRLLEKLPNRILKEVCFFGEIYGMGIQNMTYNIRDQIIRIFAATQKAQYLSIPNVIELCTIYNLPMVNFKQTIFESIEQIRELSNQPSEIASNISYREGIVLVSDQYPEKMAKSISFDYLTKKKRTERH